MTGSDERGWPERGRVFRAADLRALDEELARHDLLELTMEVAGAAVAGALHRRFPHGEVLALAGSGANGGDALVAARHLLGAGRRVRVLALEARHDLTRRMTERLSPFALVEPLTPDTLDGALGSADVVLDGLLGTGFTAPLRPDLLGVIERLNGSGRPTVSIDVPSGLPSDTPASDAPRVRADLTLTLVGLKPALLFGAEVGEVEVLELGVPGALVERFARARLLTREDAAALLPRRTRGAHKGTAGRVSVVGGSPGLTGAPAMTALGALRTGSGLVSLYSLAELPHAPVESMPHRLSGWDDLSGVPRPDAVAVGTGLGRDAVGVARRVLGWNLPTVLDADALQPGLRGAGHDRVVWTPHPGEAARMLGVPPERVTADPLAAAEELRGAFGGVVVLKGGPTTVSTPSGTWVCPFGNPGMATGGMGDVLSGVVASLLGQGLSADEAARVGVTLHALAGDLVADEFGRGLIATDVAHAVGRIVRCLAS